MPWCLDTAPRPGMRNLRPRDQAVRSMPSLDAPVALEAGLVAEAVLLGLSRLSTVEATLELALVAALEELCELATELAALGALPPP